MFEVPLFSARSARIPTRDLRLVLGVIAFFALFICFFLLTPTSAHAQSYGDGLLFYSRTGTTTPFIKPYINSTNTFGATTSVVSGSSTIISAIKSSPIKREMVAAYVDSANTLRVICYENATTSNEWSVGVGGATTTRFDVAYESDTGDVMVLYSGNASSTNELKFRTKAGTTGCGSGNWSAEQNLDPVRTTGTVQWVRMASDPHATSSLITAIWADTNLDLSAMVWSGTSWGNEHSAALETVIEVTGSTTTSPTTADVQSFDVAYESLSGDVMVVWGSGGTATVNGAFYAVCTGGTSTCTWGSVRTAMPTLADDITHVSISADPASDRILFAAIGNAGSDLTRGVWSGTAWTNTVGADDTSQTPTSGTMMVATGWLSAWTGTSTITRGIVTYYDSAATNIGWFSLNASTSAWTTETDSTPTLAFGTQTQYKIVMNPYFRNELMFLVSNNTSQGFAKRLSMSSVGALTWSQPDVTIVAGSMGTTTRRTMDFDYWMPLSLTLQGSLYENEGGTLITSAKTLAVAIGTTTTSVYATTSLTSGSWAITIPRGQVVATSTPILVWIDADPSTRAALITKASSTNTTVSGLDLYQNRVIVRHEATSGTSTTLQDLGFYTGTNDPDIQYTATTTNGSSLVVSTNQKLYVWPSRTFSASGTVEVRGNASSTSLTDGSFHIATGATYITTGTTTLAGSFTASSSATMTRATSTLLFNATTTGKFINHNALATLGTTTFSGSGGSWTFATTSTTSNLTITTGATVVAPVTTLTVSGNYTNSGTFTNNSGTTTFNSASAQIISGIATGTSAFNNVSFTGAGTKIFNNNASTTAFTINSGSGAITAPMILSVSGNYTNASTFTAGSGTTTFNGNGSQTATGTMTGTSAFNNLAFVGAGTKLFNSNASSSNFRVESEAGTTTIPSQLTVSGQYTANGTTTGGVSTWTERSSGGLGNLYGVTYGNGTFVAVSNDGGIVTSPDGITWTSRSTPNLNSLIDVTYGNGLFVAVSPTTSTSTAIMTSPDGVTWTARAATEANYWGAVTYGNGRFVAVSPDGIDRIMRSPDGINWTASQTIPGDWEGTALTYGNGIFVATTPVYSGEGRIATSPDGNIWTSRSAPYNGPITYGNGRFVVLSGINAMVSTDGIAWTSASTTEANTWESITYGEGLFVAVSSDGTNPVMTSVDGVNWMVRTSPDLFGWRAVTYGNGQFVAVGAFGTGVIMTAPHGALTFSGASAQTISGTLTGTSTGLRNVTFTGAGTKTFANNASTTAFTIESGATAVAPAYLSVSGNYTNSGTFTAGSGTTTFAGSVATGTMTGSSAFNNLDVTPVTTTGTTTFGSALTVNGHFRAVTSLASTSIAFAQGATSTFNTLSIVGIAGNTLKLRSTTNGTQWNFDVNGAYTIDYVDVKDSNACPTAATITSTNFTNSGNNTCWVAPTNTIVLSGILYSDEGVTAITSGKTIAIAVGTTTTSLHTTTSNGSGVWTFTVPDGNTIGASTPILMYVDADATTRAALFTKASSTNTTVSGLDLYQNRVIVRHEATSGTSTTLTDLGFYDNDNDSDIQYNASGTASTMVVQTNQKLFVWANGTFSATGTVEVRGNASSTSQTDGSLHIATGATFNMNGTTTLAGSLTASSSATYIPGLRTGTSTFLMNATTTGKTILAPLSSLGNITFSGSGGSWTFGTTSTTSNLTITTGATVVAPVTTLSIGGSLTQNGSLTAGATTTFTGQGTTISGNLTGTNALGNLAIASVATGTDDWRNVFDYQYSRVWDVVVDSVNGNLYSGTQEGDILRCTLSSNCNEASDFVTATNTGTQVIDLAIDTANNVLYAAGFIDAGQGMIFRCALSTGCDDTIDFTISTSTNGEAKDALVVDTVNGALYVGQYAGSEQGMIFKCLTSTGCDGPGDFSVATDTAANGFKGSVFDSENGVIYMGSYYNGSIYRCLGSTGCDGAGEWTIATVTASVVISDFEIDTTNDLLYAASQDPGSIYRCALSTGCDGAGDWFTGATFPDYAIKDIAFDSYQSVLYAMTDGSTVGGVYSCPTISGCDEQNDWKISSDIPTRFAVESAAYDPSGRVLYAGGGLSYTGPSGGIYRLDPTVRMQSAASTTNFIIDAGKNVVATSAPLAIAGAYTNNGIHGKVAQNWEILYTPTGNVRNGTPVFAQGQFVSVNQTGDTRVQTSPDGITWTDRTDGVQLKAWSGLTYGNGIFVAVSADATTTTGAIMTSSDGITWTSRNSAVANGWNSVAFGNGMFVAVSGNGTNRVMTSLNGVDWTARTVATSTWSELRFFGGQFIAVGEASTTAETVMTSPDGINWTTRNSQMNTGLPTIGYGNGRYVMLGDRNYSISTDGGITWTSGETRTRDGASFFHYAHDILFFDGMFIAAGQFQDGAFLFSGMMTSFDGIIWEKIPNSNPLSSTLDRMAYGNGTIVVRAAVCNGTQCGIYSRISTTTFSGTSAQTLSGDMSGYSKFGNVAFTGAGTKTFANNASTTNFDIRSGAGAVVAPTQLSIAGNYTNASTFTAGAGTTTFNGSNLQFATGTMTGTSAFANVVFSESGEKRIGADASTTNFITGTSTTIVTDKHLSIAGNYTNNGTYTGAGAVWTRPSNEIFGTWHAVTYGNGLFVAVGYCDGGGAPLCVATSTDGINWSGQAVLGANDDWRGVTYGNGLFVAVGTSSTDRIMTSIDGITWTSRTSPSASSWNEVTYGNGLFVAVARESTSNANAVMTSPDGITWTSRTASESNGWHSVTYGNGLFVAVGQGSAQVMTSPDGITWTDQTESIFLTWTSVTYGNGLFVAVPYDNSRFMTSPDGVTWTTRDTYNWGEWFGVTYGNGLFVAVSYNSSKQVLTSVDGINWVAQVATPSNRWLGVTYGNGRFVAVGGQDDFVMTAIDAATTFSGTSAQTISGNLTGASMLRGTTFTGVGTKTFASNASTTNFDIRSGAGAVVAPTQLSIAGNYTNSGTFTAGAGTTTFSGSTNQTLSGTMTDSSAFSNLVFTEGGEKRFDSNASTTNFRVESNSGRVAIPSNLTVAGQYNTSPTSSVIGGATVWQNPTSPESNPWNSVTYGNGLFVAVADTGTNRVMTSPDGITWTARLAVALQPWKAVTYGNGLFVAVTEEATTTSNAIMTSPDGIAWTARTAPEATDWWGVTYGNGLFVAVADRGTNRVMTSPDGITWTGYTAISSPWESVTYGNGTFVAVAWSGAFQVMTSSNGADWTGQSAADTSSWNGITFGNGLFVAVADTGTNRVMTSPDGITWTPRLATAANSWRSVAYNNGLFVAVTGDGANRVMTSPDGIMWQSVSNAPSAGWEDVASGGGLFVAVARDGGIMTAPHGALTFSGSSAQTISGTLTGTSTGLRNVTFTGAGTKTFANNASTTAFIINSGATAVAPTLLTIAGQYTNSGTFTAGSGTTTFSGSVATGTMTGSSAFNNLAVTPVSTTGTTTFGAALTVNGHFRAVTSLASTSIAFASGATTTLNTATIGGISGNLIKLRTTTPGSQSNLDVNGAYQITYVDVKDSNACPTAATIVSTFATDSGNNNCWGFAAGAATLSSAANQTFALNQGTTSISTITVTDGATPALTAANNLRIKIATSTVRMLFDTTDTTASFGGTASAKVSGTVSYESNGSVLVVDVTNDFAASDTLTISGLSYSQFSATNSASIALGLFSDGPSDSVVNASDDKSITITGSLGVLNHTLNQISDNIQFPTASDVEIFRFKLTPTGETATISQTTISLMGVDGIIQSDITNIRLYQDTNSDGDYDVSDTQVGGTPSFSLNGQTGTITFSTSYQSTTTRDYVLVADITNIRPGDFMTLRMGSGALTATGNQTSGTIPPTYTVSGVQHVKNGIGFAGGSIGGDAPAGQGIRGGGGAGGGGGIDTNMNGTVLGDAPEYFAPTSQGAPQGAWTGGASGYNSDGVYASTPTQGARHTYGTFNVSVPGTNVITGIEVKLEGSGTTAAGSIDVRLSWDGGTSLTTLKNTGTLTGTDAIYTLGGPSDTWGRSWTPAETANGLFTIEVISNVSANTVQIDAIRVNVYHQATGGGGGGGGMVYVPREYLPTRILAFLESLGVDIRSLQGVWRVVSYRI